VKVLFANNIFGYYGGVEQVILHTARGLRARGHSCALAYGTEGRKLEEFAAVFDTIFPCSEFGVQGTETGLFSTIVKSWNPDTVFYHKVTSLPPGAERLERMRTIRMQHDTDLFCPTGLGYFRHGRRVCHYPVGWRCWCDLAFLGRASQGPIPVQWVSIPAKHREMDRNRDLDAILAVSSFVRGQLLANGFPSDRVHLCHPILDLGDPAPTPPPEDPKILFVGALLRGKGIDLLLRSLHLLDIPFSAVIAGTGKSEHKLKRLSASLGLEGRVKFLGWIPPQAMPAEYAAAKVVAVPSRGPESFTLVGQESMRHGRPAVAFDVGGNSNWLEHEKTGLLVPEQDVKSYAQALRRVLTDTAYARQLGENAAKRIRERFSFEGYLDKIEGFLKGGNGNADSAKPAGANL